MPYDYHADKRAYFEHQRRVTEEHVLPFIEAVKALPAGARVLEIGCGEAGVLDAFLRRGCECVGVDLNERRLALGGQFLRDEVKGGRLRLVCGDIYLPEVRAELGTFDLIVLKDVVEHIPDQRKLLQQLESYLRPGGSVFFGFPPWFMPFGGHQQVCKSKWLSRAPYIHLLPSQLYRRLLAGFGEPPSRIDGLMRNKETGINIEDFDRMLGDTGYSTLKYALYLLNPMYSYRFGLKPFEQLGPVARVPYVRDLLSTCAYYLVAPRATSPTQ
jgi:SAM-dependent methyltransferase